MLATDTLRLAFGALSAHKLRTALTLLGLIIGVTSLILVMTLIQGANAYVETKIANLGTDIFQVSKLPLATTDYREVMRAKKFRDVTLDDWYAVQDRCRNCVGVGAQLELPGRVNSDFQSMPDVSIRGQTANMGWISTLDIAQGRFFTESEQRAAAPLVILGDNVRERLFPRSDSIGKKIRVGGGEFEVIGEAEKIGTILGQSQDNFVIIPIDAFAKLYGTRRSLVLHVKALSKDSLTATQDEVRLILRGRRHTDPLAPDGFYFTTAETYLDLWRDISSVFFIVLVLISSVASIVGGIVIMNITLVSVTERTKEIGLRRSVGARQRDIARQFLVEVLAQCLAGGLTGVVLGFALALLLRQFTPFPAVVQGWVAIMGLALASLIALTFGVYPAIKAAKLDPVVALRSE
ncbi:MAG: ABC transporter permease [Acidobacteria bacterium]|nr:ABC transporter permease [Acidobacteriota bacterium]MCL5288574.1 ABC transporter permease [Acidobacteriota bacterium]